MMKRHEVQVLLGAGHSQADVARRTEISERAVRMIGNEPPVKIPETALALRLRHVGRPSKAELFRKYVAALLSREPDVMTLEILRRARLDGYLGGKTAFYGLVSSLRPAPRRPVVRFEGLPGEFSQHDFGEVDVRFMSGETRRVHFFGSRLKYSRWVEVSIVPNQVVETLVRTLVDHFAAIGGIPLLAVFDRPKTVALSWGADGKVTEWNSTFAYVLLELGLGAEVCWPHRGNQKGSVESLVKWVKGSFFKQRRFLDEADLLQQLSEWQKEVNTTVPSRATGVVPAVRLAQEKPRLRVLKVAPESLALRFPVHVGPTGHVLFETRIYSMPPEAIGLPGTLYLYRDRVRIVAGRWQAEHARVEEKGGSSTLPEHRAAKLAAVSGKRGKLYLKRQDLLEVGAPAMEYLTEVVHRRPRAWAEDVEKLHELLQAFGPEVLRGAFEKAVGAKTIGAEYIEHYLEESLEGAHA